MKTVSKTIMKFTAAVSAVLVSGTALAVPTLQIDLEDGYYVDATQTVVTDLELFELYAIGTPDGDNNGNGSGSMSEAELLAETWYLAIALVPQSGPDDPGFGSFTVGGTTYTYADLTYGTPPIDLWEGNPDAGLAPHGTYDTLYMQIAFTFDPGSDCGTYNVQDNPGEYDGGAGTGSFCETFEINIAGLTEGFNLHFDMYNSVIANNPKDGADGIYDMDAGVFAPFSHDGETNCCGRKIPEPGTLGLLGIGLLGLALSRRRKITT